MQILAKALLLPLFLFLLSPGNIYAQKLDHVQGDILIHVESDRSAEAIIKKYRSFEQRNTSLTSRKIAAYPLNLWLLNIDHNRINENHFLSELRKENNILHAQKNHLINYRKVPDDPQFNLQWQYINMGNNGGVADADLDAELAWDFTTGGLSITGDTIVACIIDDGLDIDHEDLGDNVWYNYAEIPGNGLDDDQNGYVDDYAGWNTYTDSGEVFTGGGHGTPVAGIVGAQGNNGIGVTGVNWDVKLMIVQGGGNEANALASYAYPYYFRKLYNETNRARGAFVVTTNSSWGTDFGQPVDAPLWCAMYDSLGTVGIISCGATINGNQNVDLVGDLPTACTSNYLISVTNMNRSDEKVTGAGYGKRSIDLGAFGKDVWTIDAPNTYRGFGGTSGATPHVAGTVALLYSASCADFMAIAKTTPEKAALMVKDCILNGVDPNDDLMGITTTGGRLNMFNAVNNILEPCSDCATATGFDINAQNFNSIRITWVERPNVGSVDLRYRMEGDIEWTELTDVNHPVILEDLNLCTFYEIQTRTNCESGASYGYSHYQSTRGCCALPSGFDVEVENGEAVITWNEAEESDTYIIEIKEFDNNEWLAFPVTGELFTLDQLEECTSYEARFKVVCSDIPNESDYSGTINFNGPCGSCSEDDYCTFGETDNSGEWIESITIGDTQNDSGPDPDGYGNYIGAFSIILNQGDSVDVSLTPAYSSTIYDEYFRIYVDWNQDTEFDEETELAFDAGMVTTETITGKIFVPETAATGITRMRVVMRYDTEGFACDVFNFDYGEIEDYCVEVREPLSIIDPELTEHKIMILPNPFEDKLSISSGKRPMYFTHWEIKNIQGTTVRSGLAIEGSSLLEISGLENINSGVYLMTLYLDRGWQTFKIVKI